MRIGLLALVLLCGGCPNKPTSTGANADMAMTGGDGDMAAGEGADMATSSGPRHAGGVTLFSGSYKIGATSLIANSAAAAFNDIMGMSLPVCTSTPMGSCSVLDNCTGMLVNGTFTPESAGTISVTGGSRAITLPPNADGSYTTSTSSTSTLWNGGESLTVSAAGGVVPAFDTTIVAPNAFSITSPTLASSDITISRAADFTVTWSNGGAGTVTLLVQDRTGSGSGKSIQCTFPASANSGTIPLAAFAGIAANDTGSLALSMGTTQTLTAGEWDLTVLAYVPVTQAGAYVSVVSVTFQ